MVTIDSEYLAPPDAPPRLSDAERAAVEADPAADGVHELLQSLPRTRALTAAFDTRADMPELEHARHVGQRITAAALHRHEAVPV